MRQTAERALAEAVDTSAVQPYFVGNAPAGHVELAEAGALFFHRCAVRPAVCSEGQGRMLLWHEMQRRHSTASHSTRHDETRRWEASSEAWPSPQLTAGPPSHPSARPCPRPCPLCRCQLIQGTPALQAGSGYGEHVWVAKDELPEYIQQPELLGVLQQML
jgi:hypothetical protein